MAYFTRSVLLLMCSFRMMLDRWRFTVRKLIEAERKLLVMTSPIEPEFPDTLEIPSFRCTLRTPLRIVSKSQNRFFPPPT